MIQWARVFILLVDSLAVVVTWMHERDLISQGESNAIAAGMHLRATQLLDLTEAVEEQRRRNRAVPPTDGLPDDGFRRD